MTPIFNLLCNGRLACGQKAGEWLFGKKTFVILPNAIDIGKYRFSKDKRQNVRMQLHIDESCYVIGHVGYFNEQKNHSFLLDVFAEINKTKPDARLLLVGEGNLKQYMERKAEAMGLKDRVIFWGQSDDVSSLMCAMDLFLFPSKWEGLGIAMLEAQFSGLPCVASDAVPMEADVQVGNVRLSLSEGAAEWSQKCLKVLEKPVDRESQSAVSDCYDVAKQASVLEDFYVYRKND